MGIFNATTSKVSTGVYQVTFNTPMPDASYAVVLSAELGICTIGPGSVTPNGFQITTFFNFTGGPADSYCTFQVNATNATLPTSFTEAQIQSVLDFIAVANPAGVAKAWGNVADDGTLNDGLNASTSRDSEGRYVVVFTKPLPSANYSVQATTIGDLGSPSTTAYDLTTTGFKIRTNDGSGKGIDRNFSYTVHSN
jgi:hypothetical protein